MNEEMYEEEEDDLPLQYRRLTAHLQTGSADFNRKLSTYLSTHVAMRSAIEQAVQSSYNEQYSNFPQYAYNQQPLYPAPMAGSQGQQQMFQQPTEQWNRPQQMPQQNSPMTYRQAPYPQANPFQSQHNRSASIATPQEFHGSQDSNSPMVTPDQRRMSMPATPAATATSTSSPSVLGAPLAPKPRPSYPQGSFSQLNTMQQQYIPNQQMLPTYDASSVGNIFPLTAQPSTESQMFFGGFDHLTANLMAGAPNYPQQNFDWAGSFESLEPLKKENQESGLGMSIAPSQLQLNEESQTLDDDFFPQTIARSEKVSPTGTPGGWDNFIDDSQWQTSSQ